MIDRYQNNTLILSLSGGKDSTAMGLNLLEQGYKVRFYPSIY